VELRIRDEDGKPGGPGEKPRLWDKAVGGILRLVDHRAGQQPVHDLDSDEVEHDRAQDLVDVEIGLERSGDRPPGRTAGRASEEHERDELDARQVRQRERCRRARQASHRQLALAADVEDVGAERDADPDGDEKKWGGLHGRRAERVAAVERPDDEGVVAGDRVGSERQHHDSAEQQRRDEGKGKRKPAQEEPSPVLPGIRGRHADATQDQLPVALLTGLPVE
jgi:hypothetical protein